MKKRAALALLLSSLVLFLCVRLYPAKENPRSREIEKPTLLPPYLLAHPWVKSQPLKAVNPEMARDLAELNAYSAQLFLSNPELTRDVIEAVFIDRLTALQKDLPFSFPGELYNVLCIRETPMESLQPPHPFHVYKRLYLGESEIGFPVYLDVRVFEVARDEIQSVVTWHLERLEGEAVCHFDQRDKKRYTSQGFLSGEQAHGWGKDLGERGLFADFIYRDEKLYVLYCEAPLESFLTFAQRKIFDSLL